MEKKEQFATMPSNEVNGPYMWTFDMESTETHNQSTCNQILDFLFLGGHMAAENVKWLREMNITCVINVRKVPVQNTTSDVEYMNIEVDDDEYEPIHWFFDDAVKKIEDHRAANGKVLINCEMGISRSATICLIYLVHYHNWTLRHAYYELKKLRPCIYPNNYFWGSMVKYEKKIRGRASVRLQAVGWTRPIPDVYLNGVKH